MDLNKKMLGPVFASVEDYDNTNWICVHFVVLPCQNKSPLSDRVTVRKFCSLRDIKQTSVVFGAHWKCQGTVPVKTKNNGITWKPNI